jgi:hypothetical protein
MSPPPPSHSVSRVSETKRLEFDNSARVACGKKSAPEACVNFALQRRAAPRTGIAPGFDERRRRCAIA